MIYRPNTGPLFRFGPKEQSALPPVRPFRSPHSSWQATSYVSLSTFVSTRLPLTPVMHWHISLSDRIGPRILAGMGLLPYEKVVRIIDQHSWPTPAAFSMTPDYLALDYLAQHIPHAVYIYLATHLPLPLFALQPTVAS
jgi:hypothetical protein